MIRIVKVSDARTVDRQLAGLPEGMSFFTPIINHEAKEALEAGGEVFVSEVSDGEKNGLLIYDNYEATGTIFTRSREAFDRFYEMKPSSYIFSELDVPDRTRESWNIWQLDVDKTPFEHRFKHRVTMDDNPGEIERFMAISQPETNPKWVSVALKSGDRCFVVKISDRIVGMAWMSIVGGTARSHGLYTNLKFRRTGITTDIFYARLIYLKSMHVHTLINEIAESNVASSNHAKNVGEKVVGRMFLYTTPESESPA